jgi:AraC family transcriptional regulator
MSSQPSPNIRKVHLAGHRHFDAYLAYYPPRLKQPEHEHACSQLSILLAGSLTECVKGRCHEAGPAQVSAKPKGTVHADEYGPGGALLLSFNFRCEETALVALNDQSWHWRKVRAEDHSLAVKLAHPALPENLTSLLWDVLSLGERTVGDARPPGWLSWVRSQLDRPGKPASIGSLAAQAGVHRVHLSRQFLRHYGITPSMYRQRQMAGRALWALIDDRAPAAAAAHDAGFADQSHMARAIRNAFGTTPGQLASLLEV